MSNFKSFIFNVLRAGLACLGRRGIRSGFPVVRDHYAAGLMVSAIILKSAPICSSSGLPTPTVESRCGAVV
jgi:hypothetical protein